jgi:diaminopimelate decarboxylase
VSKCALWSTFSDSIPQPSNFALRIGGYSKKDGGELKTDERKVDVAGPLCFAGDKIATQISLPSLTEGDVLVVHDTGANTLSTFSRHCSRSQVMSPLPNL